MDFSTRSLGAWYSFTNVQVMGAASLDAAPPTFLKLTPRSVFVTATSSPMPLTHLMSLRFHLSSPPVEMSFSVMVKSELPTSKGMKVESYFAFAAPKPVGVRLATGSAAEMYEVLAGADEAVGFVTVTVPVVSGLRAVLSRQVSPVVTVKLAAGIAGYMPEGSSTDFTMRTLRSSVMTP